MTLAIIDGDVLAYQACRNRHTRDNTTALLDWEGRLVNKTFSKEEDVAYFKASWKNFKEDLHSLLEKLYCTDYLMAVKGDSDFRKTLYAEYKLNRHADPMKQNPFVPKIRKLAVYEGYAIFAHGREADDMLRIWALEAQRAGRDYIICSIDKDLRCIPGKHYVMHFDPAKQVTLNISEWEAKRHYYEQMLKGDPTDKIPGVPLVGEVKAKNLLSECLSEEEMQEVVVSEYLAAYGEDWYNYFLINAKLIHLQTHENDYFDVEAWPIVQELMG